MDRDRQTATTKCGFVTLIVYKKHQIALTTVGSEGNRYEWEDGLVQLWKHNHCEIHVFDPW
jgi:hypothetical protein